MKTYLPPILGGLSQGLGLCGFPGEAKFEGGDFGDSMQKDPSEPHFLELF
jgi:hypothetical protein